jgi:hypothetical protein
MRVPAKQRKPDLVDLTVRALFAIVVAALVLFVAMVLSLRGPAPESIQVQLRPAVRAVLDYRKVHARLPERLEDLGAGYVGGYHHGWNHDLKREVFTISAGGRPRVVWYDSEKGWFTAHGEAGASASLGPVEPP